MKKITSAVLAVVAVLVVQVQRRQVVLGVVVLVE